MAMRSIGRRRSLRILSPDFIGKVRDETATQVTRIHRQVAKSPAGYRTK